MLVTVLQLFSTVRSPLREEARGGRPAADGINLAQPKAAAQSAEAWSLFRTSLKTCSSVLAGCRFTHHARRGNLGIRASPEIHPVKLQLTTVKMLLACSEALGAHPSAR